MYKRNGGAQLFDSCGSKPGITSRREQGQKQKNPKRTHMMGQNSEKKAHTSAGYKPTTLTRTTENNIPTGGLNKSRTGFSYC